MLLCAVPLFFFLSAGGSLGHRGLQIWSQRVLWVVMGLSLELRLWVPVCFRVSFLEGFR